MAEDTVRVGIIGMGGFAQSHHRAIRALEEEGACRLVCTCDPNRDAFAEQRAQWELAARNVATYTNYVQMLDAEQSALDVVTVPTPIPLHAPMHRACVARELPCYLEKPPTLDYAELAEMLAVEASARRQTQVAFNFIVENARQKLKERLVRGEWGRLRRVGFAGFWPRATTYYTRAGWAGRLRQGDHLVLDSCIGNAMAHYLHNALFWCGRDTVLSWDEVAATDAELYRAHAIESFDTCFVRGRTTGGMDVHIAATHAGQGPQYHREWLECDDAIITYVTGEGYRIEPTNGGAPQTGPADLRPLLQENFRAYFAYLHGEAPRPLTRLEDARPFVHFYDLMFVAAGQIHTVAREHTTRTDAPGGGEWVAIENIGDACETFAATGQFPSETGAAWGRPGGQATRDELPQLRAVVDAMYARRG